MAVYYYIKKNKKDASIYFRFVYQRQKSYFQKFTGERIPINAWDAKKQKVKELVTTYAYASKINKRLDHITKTFEDQTKGEEVTKTLLNRIWDRMDQTKSQAFTDFCENHIEWIKTHPHPKTKRPYSKETIKKYEQTLKKFNEFQDNEYPVNFKELDQQFHSDFIKYFEGQGLAGNSIGVFVKFLKVMAKQAAKDHPVHSFILSDEFFLPQNDTHSIYCSVEEIKKIKEVKLDNESLNNIRNWFIFGCWTGLRVSDWKRVQKIDTSDKVWYFDITPEKTKYTSGKKVSIPVHPWIKEILEKEGMPYHIADQNFNEGIKKVAKEAGLIHKEYGSKTINVNPNEDEKAIMRRKVDLYPKHELISSHTCRRSFATNNYLLRMPTITIMAITGHTTEKNFLKYIKVTPRQHAHKMMEIWQEHF